MRPEVVHEVVAHRWIYQHGLRHMGEIELARGLVGLGGMTS